MDSEEKRLYALQQYDILDTEAEEAFDNLAKLAAQICDTSSAQINFIDRKRQWSKADIGWGTPELPREMSFCTHTIQSDDSMMIVTDTGEDERFKDNPLAKKDPPLRFYAGATIKSQEGYPIGTLCVFDSEPKQLSEKQSEALQMLAKEVETHLKLRINRSQLHENLVQENQLNKKIIQNLPLNFFMYNAEGKIVRWNEYMKSMTGYTDEEIQQNNPEHYFDTEDRLKVKKKMEEVFSGKQVTFEADFIRKDGSTMPSIFSASRFETNGQIYLIGTGQDVTQLKQTQHKLEQSLQEKEILLAEIHHRVKNNLAVISGLIELETMDPEESDVHKKLLNTSLRIRSMARIHEIMYQTDNLTHVVFEDVVEPIANNVKDTYSKADDITLTFDIEKITLNVNQAIPCGLIINELLTNAWKHAYPEDRKGRIELEMSESNGMITLRIADQGIGLPENINPDIGETLGFTIVHQLCNQLDAEINLNQDSGTEFIIQFAKKDVKGAGSALESNL